jgi:ferritin-like metal-binding protein YciE
MMKAASDIELKQILQSHLEETEGHVIRLEHVFQDAGREANIRGLLSHRRHHREA